MRMFWDYSWF